MKPFIDRNTRVSLLPFVVGICLAVSPANTPVLAQAPTESADEPAAGLPDLNRLRNRVLEFWSLFTGGKRAQGLSYILPEGQEQVLNWKWPPVKSFHIEEMRFLEDAVLVGMRAVVQPAGFPSVLEWPVNHRWVLQENKWFLKVEGISAMAKVFGVSLPQTAGSEAAPQILKDFRLPSGPVDLGEVTQGEAIFEEISYSNPGSGSVVLSIDESPSWLAFDGTRLEIGPGDSGVLTLAALTDRLEGQTRGRVAVELSQGEEAMSREFEVRVSVSTSFQIVPSQLILLPGRSYEVLVRNSTDRPLEIKELRPSASFIRISSAEGRMTLEPGGQTALTVTWEAGRAPEDWAGGWITLSLSEPVNGRTTFRINLFRGFEQ